jgi:hypothetical protein
MAYIIIIIRIKRLREYLKWNKKLIRKFKIKEKWISRNKKWIFNKKRKDRWFQCEFNRKLQKS